MAAKTNGTNTGKIVEIKGVVLDAVFPDRLPRSTTLSASTSPGTTGRGS